MTFTFYEELYCICGATGTSFHFSILFFVCLFPSPILFHASLHSCLLHSYYLYSLSFPFSTINCVLTPSPHSSSIIYTSTESYNIIPLLYLVNWIGLMLLIKPGHLKYPPFGSTGPRIWSTPFGSMGWGRVLN